MLNKKLTDQVFQKIPTGKLRHHETRDLIRKIVESLYLTLCSRNKAWRGRILFDGRQIVIREHDGTETHLDKFTLPVNESGTLIWIEDESGGPEDRIQTV